MKTLKKDLRSLKKNLRQYAKRMRMTATNALTSALNAVSMQRLQQSQKDRKRGFKYENKRYD